MLSRIVASHWKREVGVKNRVVGVCEMHGYKNVCAILIFIAFMGDARTLATGFILNMCLLLFVLKMCEERNYILKFCSHSFITSCVYLDHPGQNGHRFLFSQGLCMYTVLVIRKGS